MKKIPISLIEQDGMGGERCNAIDDITDSFLRQGQLSPILVRKHSSNSGQYQLIFGNRRLSAARKLGWKLIDAEVVEANDVEALTMSFSENVDRSDFTDYEKAMLLQKLHDVSGKNYVQIAQLVGKSCAFVSQHLNMLHLFPSYVASEKERHVVLNSLSEGHARVLARIADYQERWNTAKLAIRANLSVRELQKICRNCENDEGSSQYKESLENVGSTASPKNVEEIARNIVKGLNSKDMRAFLEFVSARHFSMFPGISSLGSVIEYKDIEEYLFETHKKTIEHKHGAPTYTDAGSDSHIGYVVMAFPDDIMTHKGRVKTTTRATLIFEKEGEKWKMVHSHWSTASPSIVSDLLTERNEPVSNIPLQKAFNLK